jgi:hypothetical protein
VTAETFCLKARPGVCRRDRAFVLTSVRFQSSSPETHQLSTLFLNAFHNSRRYDREVFLNRKNFFAWRNLTAMVLEIPNGLLGASQVNCWATVSLFGHAPEVQVQRWGLPLLHIFS